MTSNVESKKFVFRIEMTMDEYNRFCAAANSFFEEAVKKKDKSLLRDAESVQSLKNSLSLALYN